MACPHCGSWAVRSDRALAGRMVCGRCGQPLGRSAGQRAQRPRGPWRPRVLTGHGRPGIWLLVLGLVMVSAVLAQLDSQVPQRRGSPAGTGTWHGIP